MEGAVCKLQCVEAHGGTVEQAQANPARGGVEARVGDAVDHGRGSEKAQGVIAFLIDLSVLGELRVHDDYRDIVHTVVLGQVQVIGNVIVDEEHARQPAVGVRGRGHVRVRVVPQRGRRLGDLPLGFPGLAHLNRRVRAAIRVGRQLHAMPVHRGHLNEVVRDLRADLLPTPGAQRGPQEGAVETPRPRAVVAGENLRVTVLRGELEYSRSVNNFALFHRRDGQGARLTVIALRLRLILRGRCRA